MSRPFAMSRANGFTLTELMIALLIGLFITGGLLTLMFAMRRNTASQAGMSQLQDNERMAMSVITGAIQSAGYYPDAYLNWASGAAGFFPATTTTPAFATAGQPIVGTHVSATASDTLLVRYATNGTDGILNCAGTKSTTAKMWTTTLSVVASGSSGVLQCVLDDGTTSSTLPLVFGITNMQILYGVQTGPGTANSIDTYLSANQMTPAYWNSVLSVRITLYFDNPLNQPGKPALTPINFTRVIALMNKTGVDT